MDSIQIPLGCSATVDHLYRLYGPWNHAVPLSTRDAAVLVLTWPPERTGEDVFIWVTVGAARHNRSAGRSCEFALGLVSEPHAVARSMAEIALAGNGTGRIPKPGDSVTLVDPLWEGTEIRTALFHAPGEDIVPSLRGHCAIRFVQLVPLHEAERLYNSAHGYAALWSAFRERLTPYWDPNRPSAL